MEKLLILNGSFCELPLIQEAKKLGYYVITTGNMPDLIGHKYADEYICADYSDKELILGLVKEKNINKIVSCANDFGVLTASYVAEQMGWGGHDSYEIAELLHHKDKFKHYAEANGFPAPKSYSFQSEKEAIEYINNVEYPIIVKANDLTGGKGIMKATTPKEAVSAIKNSFECSRNKHIVIEPFIDGLQQTLVTFIHNEKIVASVSTNSYSPINPYLIQSETLPAEGIEMVKDELYLIIENMAQKLHLADGILAFQYIRKGGRPYIIEMMRRPFGNQFLTLAELNSGFPWHKAQLIAETGGNWNEIICREPKMRFCGHHGIMATHNGVVKEYRISPEIEKHIFKKIEMIAPGGTIKNYMNERIAYIYYEYESLSEMNKAVKHFNEGIEIKFAE